MKILGKIINMTSITFLWYKKHLLKIESDKINFKVDCKSKIDDFCKILGKNIQELKFEKLSTVTGVYEETELKDFEDGDEVNVVLKSFSSLRDELNGHEFDEELRDELYKKLHVLNKVMSNRNLNSCERKYIYDFIMQHTDNCHKSIPSYNTFTENKKKLMNGNGHSNFPEDDFKSPKKKQKMSNDQSTHCELSITQSFKHIEKKVVELFSNNPEDPEFKKLSKLLFPQRRFFIVSDKPPKVQQVKQRYPYLFTLKQIFNEFELISNKQNMFESFKKNVEKFSCIVMRLSVCSENRKIPYLVKTAKETDKTWIQHCGSLFMLPKYMEESRWGIILFQNESSPKKSYPYIRSVNDISQCLKMDSEFEIIVEGVVICKAYNLIEAYFGLMAAYYVFNAVYPDSCWKTFALLERLYSEYAPDPEVLSEKDEEKIEFLREYSLFLKMQGLDS